MRKTVLLVDDDPSILRLFARLLGEEYLVLTADSGVGAVERVEAQPVDLVLMDLKMPGLDGWMAMSLIRARLPRVPFLVVTSSPDGDLEERARAAGAAGFLPKPVDGETLRRAVARAL